MTVVVCPYCDDVTEQSFMLSEFTCGACSRPFDARVEVVANVLRQLIGPSPVETPFGYDAAVLAQACLRALDSVFL